MTDEPDIRLAYLLSRYPAISHTFILREVRRLRGMGFGIRVASINSPDRPDSGLTEEERQEAASTYYVKRAGALGALCAHAAVLFRRPWSYIRGLFYALRLGGADMGRLLYNVLYFVEAVMVGRWMARLGLRRLHIHFATPASTVGLIATRVFPIRLSIMVHGPDELYDVTRYRLKEKMEACSFVLCIGMFARSQMMKITDQAEWAKFEVTPLGVDTEVFAPRPFRERPSPFEALCVGRLVPAKGQRVLVSAVGRLIEEGRDIRLRLVGDGPDRAGLERFVAERGLDDAVIFEGAVNQDRIRELYAGADVFALASFAEGIPVVLMEAMAMEIPCVSTFVAGIPELIRDGKDGLLVYPSDEDALAASLARLMDEPDLRRRLGEAGRRRALEKYNLETNTARLAEVLRRRINGDASAGGES